jgi:hypothetical protein
VYQIDRRLTALLADRLQRLKRSGEAAAIVTSTEGMQKKASPKARGSRFDLWLHHATKQLYSWHLHAGPRYL